MSGLVGGWSHGKEMSGGDKPVSDDRLMGGDDRLMGGLGK